MTTCEQDPDVVRWGLHLLDVCSLSNFGACSIVTQYDSDLSNVSEYARERYVEDYTNVESDEIIAIALQEELSHVAAAEACGISNGGEELMQASVLSQDWLGCSRRQYNSGSWNEHDEKVVDDLIINMGKANHHSKEENKNQGRSELEFPTTCPSTGENPFTEEDLTHSLDITDEYALDGEVVKRLDQMVPIPHVPKINGEIPSFDEETSDHQRLIDRLQLYELVELKVQGDGNCQFRAISDQLYRSPDHHKFAREQIVNQLKSHPEIYSGYVPMAYGDYLRKMSKSGEWGDHVTLQAAADTYGVKIFMITSFRDTCYIEILPHIQKSERVIFLSFWAEVHYNSIYPEGDLPTEPTKKKKWWIF